MYSSIVEQNIEAAPTLKVSRRFRSLRRAPRFQRPAGASQEPYGQINVVITCKGRLRFVERTIRLTLEQKCRSPFRVILVDYGDPDDSFGWAQRNPLPRLVAMRVLDNTTFFNVSRARNCGANLLPSDLLCFVDSDSMVHPQMLEFASYLVNSGNGVLARRNTVDGQCTTYGVCCVRTGVYRAIHGYDETFEGWGPEDWDFYRRAGRCGAVRYFPPWAYPITLWHSNTVRTKYYAIKNIMESAAKSSALANHPNRPVNVNGYGRTAALVSLPEDPQRVHTWQVREPGEIQHEEHERYEAAKEHEGKAMEINCG